MGRKLFTTKTLVRIAVLVAISIVLKSFFSLETQVFRLTFFDIPLMILGLVAGPIGALMGGFIVDWVHTLYSPFAFSFNLFTISTMMWGFIPALFFFRRKITVPALTIVIVFTSVIAFSLNTYQLYLWMGEGILAALPARIITMVLKLPIQVMLVRAISHALYEYDDNIIHGKEVYTK